MKFDDIDFDELLASDYKEEIEAILSYIDGLEYDKNRLQKELEDMQENEEPEAVYGLPRWDY
ncbi:MAG: hypothetical protein K2M17_00520 [Bacilli bacterium]|nr:hypothetical protein [Bacilli bacterium]